MRAFAELLEKGGLVMIPIIALSLVLYSRCFRLLLSLRRARRTLETARIRDAGQLSALWRLRDEVQESFRRQRFSLGAMIAAAPLLGLLGTVTGMEKTFHSLAGRAGDKSMEGLARGISEVLVATESGLMVAIPALLLVYLAHRQMHKQVQLINGLERGLPSGGAS